MRWSCLGGSGGGIGRKGEISPSLPYTLQQRRQSKIPGPPVRTPMFWGLNPKPVGPKEVSGLECLLSTSSGPLSSLSPWPSRTHTHTHTLGVA